MKAYPNSNGKPISDKAGHKRQESEEALLVSDSRLARILDIAEDAIISCDETGHIILFNQLDLGDQTTLTVILRDITERKQVEVALREHSEIRANLLKQLKDAQEAERKRLSREIHDSPLQSLGVALLAIDRAKRRLTQAQVEVAQQELTFLRTSLVGTIRELRGVLADLVLDVLTQHGLVVALEGYIERFSDITGIRVELTSALAGAGAGRLSADTEMLMYRLAQEALANIRKHSQASRVTIGLDAHNGKLSMIISDDGVGFDVEGTMQKRKLGEGLGLLSMKERVELVGGQLRILSVLGEGTTLGFTCPAVHTPKTGLG